MAALRNPFHDAVARALAVRGRTTQADVVRAVCEEFDRKPMSPANSRRLCQRPDINARIGELRAMAADPKGEETAATIARVNEELARIGFHNPKNVFERDTKGRLVMRDLLSLPDYVAASISGVEFNEDGSARPRFHPKVPALAQLSKNLGVVEKVELTDKIDVSDLSNLSDEQLANLEAIMRAAADARGSGTRGGSQSKGPHRAGAGPQSD